MFTDYIVENLLKLYCKTNGKTYHWIQSFIYLNFCFYILKNLIGEMKHWRGLIILLNTVKGFKRDSKRESLKPGLHFLSLPWTSHRGVLEVLSLPSSMLIHSLSLWNHCYIQNRHTERKYIALKLLNNSLIMNAR